jgi:hypothetical protein
MSLIPIIYTSLLIVAAFLIIVLTISYLSYKAKVRKDKGEEEYYEEIPQHTVYREEHPAQQEAQVNNHMQPLKKTRVTQENMRYSSEKEYRKERKTTGEYYPTKNLTVRNKIKRTTNYDSSNQRQSSYKFRVHNTRLEVINNNSDNIPRQDYKTMDEFFPEMYASELAYNNQMADYNFLNFYSDQNDNNLYTLSTKRAR